MFKKGRSKSKDDGAADAVPAEEVPVVQVHDAAVEEVLAVIFKGDCSAQSLRRSVALRLP